MANTYSESLKGFGTIPPSQGIYEESSTAKAVIGTRLQVGDRVFYYALNGGTALVAGKLVKSLRSNASFINVAVAATAAVGTYAVRLTTGAANTTCTEGYLQINDAAGEGLQYRIKAAAANATTATSTDLTLYDPIITALTTASEGTILYNPFHSLTVCSAYTDSIIGVPPIPVTADYYFWLQTWGPCPVLSEGIPAAGSAVVVAVTTGAGGVTTWGAVAGGASCTSPIVGRMLGTGVDTEYRPVYLTIVP
jgi:hypothetical protein